jgi:hypothetical protein
MKGKKKHVSVLPYVADYCNSLRWKVTHITLQVTAVIKRLHIGYIIIHTKVFVTLFSHKSYY